MARKNKKTGKQKQKEAANALASAGAAIVPKGTFRKAGSKVGGGLGSALGGVFGSPAAGARIGSLLGGGLGQAFSELVGMGDYRVKSNSIFDGGGTIPAGEPVPNFGSKGFGVVIVHREYVGDVSVPASPADFNLTAYRINPANVFLFPWLSSLARLYTQYRILGMVVEYRPTTGNSSVSGALGSVVMATEYDVDKANFPDKRHMLNSEYATSGNPSQHQVHSIECDPEATASELYYTRDANTVSSTVEESRGYDLGILQLATQGLPGTEGDSLGEIYVNYHVELLKPVLPTGFPYSGEVTGGGGFTDESNVFGSAPAVDGSVCEVTAVAGNSITFLIPGQWIGTLYFTAATAPPTFDSLGGTATSSALTDGTASATMTSLLTFTVQAEPGQTLTFVFTGGETPTGSQLLLAPFPVDLDSF
jgi:hypothetical protein